MKRRFKNIALNTFDWYGSHTYQHPKTEEEIWTLAASLQPIAAKLDNVDKYFDRWHRFESSPFPPGLARRRPRCHDTSRA